MNFAEDRNSAKSGCAASRADGRKTVFITGGSWRNLAVSDCVPSRSFVIPVLDYSLNSEFNILSLLLDLKDIPGHVIVIFNDPKIAEELRNHSRIDHYVIMKRNVGVSRAWNVGIDVAESPTVFFLNADLHVEIETIELLERALWKLDRAACAGPQGGFVDFRLAADHFYFEKGSFRQPIEVDVVSGFLFCVKRELFDDAILRFETALTPCYFEELDLGLQIRRAGRKSYIVPATGYDHRWGGTIGALETIPFLGREEAAASIEARNRELFYRKWRAIASLPDSSPNLLDSCWGGLRRKDSGNLHEHGRRSD